MIHGPLPDHMLALKVVQVSDQSSVPEAVRAEAMRCASASGWNPKVVPLEGDTVCVDFAFRQGSAGDLALYKTTELCGHPVLEALNAVPNIPRAVKAIYRKEVRLKHLRATDYWTIMRDVDAAEAAWRKHARKRLEQATK